MNITRSQRIKAAKVAKELKIEFVVLYGSHARGEEREDSDLDIAIFSKNKPDYKLFKESFSKLSSIFRGKNLDVRFLNEADLLFSKQVVTDGILFFGNKDDYESFRLLVFKRYIDDGKKYFPYLDERVKTQQHFLNL